MDFTNKNYTASMSSSVAYNEGLRKFMLQVFNYMALALAMTGIVAMFAASSPAIMSMLYVIKGGAIIGMAPLGWLVTFAPIGLVLFLGMGMSRMRPEVAQMVFWVYAVLMGLSMSSIFLMYTGESVARVFFVTASVFGAMSLYGYTTKKSLASMGSFFMMGLMGVIIASLINMFMRSSGLHFALSVVSVIIFTGLTAYDTQRLKTMYSQVANDEVLSAKFAILGALTLYMNFINIFVQLLQLMGNRRD